MNVLSGCKKFRLESPQLKINENYLNLKDNYLFATIFEKVKKFQQEHPAKKIINMGIGDVTQPLCKEVISSLHSAVDEMGNAASFKGYGPYEGYEFLRSKIKDYYSSNYDVNLSLNEIFINDGAKSDCGHILDIFSNNQTTLIIDPTYPAYVDTNIMFGNKTIFAKATKENGFLPLPPPNAKADLIYLCSPNNPTGATFSKQQLKQWVDFANNQNAIILFDSAYNAFIADDELPRSIFEIDEARTCAIELCSLSKTAGFTGLRCGFTIVPAELKRGNVSLNKLWLRHQAAHFNGVAYIVQKAAAAVFSEKGQQQIKQTLNIYRQNAEIMIKALTEMDVFFTGGTNSPYIWFECFNEKKSWEFFDLLLDKLQIIGTPGVGFGQHGEHFFRLTSFSTKDKTIEAMARLKTLKN